MGHFPFYFEREKVLLDQSMCSLFYYLFLLLTCHENILSFLGAIENLYVANKVISSVLVEGYSKKEKCQGISVDVQIYSYLSFWSNP